MKEKEGGEEEKNPDLLIVQWFSCAVRVDGGLIIAVIFSETKWAAKHVPPLLPPLQNSYFNPGEHGQSNMSSLYPLILKQIITHSTDRLWVVEWSGVVVVVLWSGVEGCGCESSRRYIEARAALPRPPHWMSCFTQQSLYNSSSSRRISFIFINFLKESYGPVDTNGCMDQITSAILDSLTVRRRAKCCWLLRTCYSCLHRAHQKINKW